ncbi:hypothetical protein BN997_01132 [Oceanobacillus oncorhynchi]|uniref:DUF1617 family protein n=1 Tax=Oceanobacillus oncorhynchi TaxID=545501 RepID=A0A0A1MNI2_9BACI|nr:hypothetical protein [Oceanobacillus oncorhynchi]CEI81314.1 hypothetical protein BN997_01132 [Oceanobacillus oncorhynchi]
MTIKLQNKDLRNVADFLKNTLSVKGKKNVHRMRVVKAIADKDKEVREEEVTLLKDYAKLDDEEEIIFLDNGQPIIKEKKEFNEAHKDLFEEEFVLDDKNLESSLKTVEKLVNDFDKELSGQQAEAHFILAEAFENAEEEETKEEENDNDE